MTAPSHRVGGIALMLTKPAVAPEAIEVPNLGDIAQRRRRQLFQTDSPRRRTTRHFSPVARSHIPTMYQLLWELHIVHTDKTVFR
jgi:hypothetical protein